MLGKPLKSEWRPRRPDPEHTKCGMCRRTFYAGTLPPQGRERWGPFKGTYLCAECRAECRAELSAPPPCPTDPMF